MRSAALLLSFLALAACQTAPDPIEPAADTTAVAGHGAHGAGDTLSSYDDARFLDRMVAHHEMALQMAALADSHAADPRLKALAADMRTAQQAEIDSMAAWRARWFADAPAPEPLSADDHAAMGMAAPMDSLLVLRGEAFDRRFLRDMIPHHAGAIVMAAEAGARSARPEVRALAEAIVADQAREIGQMQAWRR